MKLPVREADLVYGIYQGLTLCGRIVLRCGQWRADRAGSDPGLPDLFVWAKNSRFHPVNHPNDEQQVFVTTQGWIGLEVKTDTGKLSDAQKMLNHLGCTVVVRSIEEAFAAVGEPWKGS